MKLRKRAIGDLYLAASIIFLFLAFLYYGFEQDGIVFLVLGLAIAGFGMKTKQVMLQKEKKGTKKSKKKKR